LDYHFPNADSHIDICKTDFKKYANKIDILTGGFPCQPFSLAGKRKGQDDERYLWGEMLRAIQEIKPRFVIAENVFGITNIDGGLVFEQVCVDLETAGYEVQPFVIPACSKNAPHRRDRCWFIGFRNASDNYGIIRGEGREFESAEQSRHGESNENSDTKINWITTNSNGNDGRSTDRESGCQESETNGEGEQSVYSRTWTTSNKGVATNTIGIRYRRSSKTQRSNISRCEWELEKNIRQHGNKVWSKIKRHRTHIGGIYWENFPTESPVCSGDDGIPTEMDGITFPKWRAESIKGYGNAIVPQIAYQLFEIINEL
jgi:DNA (cytosine-5)-methyltransferase 1